MCIRWHPQTHAQAPRLGLLPFDACMCHSDPPRIKDVDATAQLILDLLELCQALLHFFVQLHAAGSLDMTAIAFCTAITTCSDGSWVWSSVLLQQGPPH